MMAQTLTTCEQYPAPTYERCGQETTVLLRDVPAYDSHQDMTMCEDCAEAYRRGHAHHQRTVTSDTRDRDAYAADYASQQWPTRPQYDEG